MKRQTLATCAALFACSGCIESDPGASFSAAALTDPVEESGTVTRDEWQQFGPFYVGEGALTATLTMKVGDADLYLRRGAAPTALNYDCRPYLGGTQREECSIEGPATVYVAVAGYGWRTRYELRVTSSETESPVCGNAALDPGEVCDGKPRACVELNPAWTFGEAPCSDDCRSWDESACDPPHEQSFSGEGTLSARRWRHYGPFNATDASIVAALSPVESGGDADLYIRRSAPATAESYDCRSNGSTSEERCVVDGPGLYYVSVYGYSPASNYAIDVSYWDRYSMPETRTNRRSGSVAEGEWYFLGPLFPQAGLAQVALAGTGDADLYVRIGQKPSADQYDCRPYRSSSDEFCNLDISSPGQEIWVGIRGYALSSVFELLAVNQPHPQP